MPRLIRDNRIRKILKHREIKEGLLDYLKPSMKGVAHIKAKHHDRLANKFAEKPGKEFYRHENAARRFKKIADGKKPFGEKNEYN